MAQDRGLNLNTVLTVVAVGGAAWLVYQLFNKGSQAAAAISQAILPNPTSQATIVLTDTGQSIPWGSVTWFYPPFFSSDFFWGYQHFIAGGTEYKLTNQNPDATNTYFAAPVSS